MGSQKKIRNATYGVWMYEHLPEEIIKKAIDAILKKKEICKKSYKKFLKELDKLVGIIVY